MRMMRKARAGDACIVLADVVDLVLGVSWFFSRGVWEGLNVI
jgi:hypothetical protein